jgi:drug/metabolite transporter (DMT)-like permease
MSPHTKGALYGLTAALLFGMSAPVAKLFLAEVSPVLMAGLLYAGGGLGLLLCEWGRRRWGSAIVDDAPLRRADLPLLTGIVCLGGMGGPILMLLGLQRLSGVFGSLLLNLEAPFTIVLAVGLFKEHLTRKEAAGAAIILLGAGLIGYAPFEPVGDLVGVLALSGATVCWALDNNLTQRLSSLRDPLAVMKVKAISAGIVMIGVGCFAHDRWPEARVVAALMGLGMVSYGVSLVLDAYALRFVGAAREAAYFATAPFVGAAFSVPLLGDTWGSREVLVALLMGVGVLLLQGARHVHLHTHAETEHDHLHSHTDPHHDHHETFIEGAHVHQHRHHPITHDHAHVSDLHHRHPHA